MYINTHVILVDNINTHLWEVTIQIEMYDLVIEADMLHESEIQVDCMTFNHKRSVV